MNTPKDINNPLEPGQDLMNLVKGGFVAQGKSMAQWCREHSICRTNAQYAVMGLRNGPKARDLRERVLKASGVIPCE